MKQIVGIAWFDETTFGMAQECFGFDFIPPTFFEQAVHQQATEDRFRKQGFETYRVPVDPIPVSEWMIQQDDGEGVPSHKLLHQFAQDYIVCEECAPDLSLIHI